MTYDVVIVGGGPAGLAAALTLGRARRRVLLCDAGTPRNAAAVHVHNFVTRDGITPAEFRRIAREQLAAFPDVHVWDAPVLEISGTAGQFAVRIPDATVVARRILLCVGVIDEPPAIDGMRELWGTSIFQCPYCHAWERQDGRFAYLASSPHALDFSILLRAWTQDVLVLTNGEYDFSAEARTTLTQAGVAIDDRPVRRLIAPNGRLSAIEYTGGATVACDVLFVHPHQRQVPLVANLGLALDANGYVQVNEKSETSIPGIYAAGDLISAMQSAILGAAAGSRAAGMLNPGLVAELALDGRLD